MKCDIKLSKWQDIMAELSRTTKKLNIQNINRRMKSSYAGTFNLIKMLEHKKYVKLSKIGLGNVVTLTDEGKIIALALKTVKDQMKDIQPPLEYDSRGCLVGFKDGAFVEQITDAMSPINNREVDENSNSKNSQE